MIDTPLAEAGIIGTAIGMALYGLRPVPEIQFADFIFPAFDQIVNELAKFRYRSGGEYPAPVVIRTPVGGGIRGGHYHSQSPEALFIHTPGLKVVCPSNPYDAKGLLLACDPRRTIRCSSSSRSASTAPRKGEVPEGDYTVPLGKAKVVREGTQVTVLALGRDGARRRSRRREQAAERGHRRRGHRPAHAVAVRHRRRSSRR